jgi:hypothetical protein
VTPRRPAVRAKGKSLSLPSLQPWISQLISPNASHSRIIRLIDAPKRKRSQCSTKRGPALSMVRSGPE